MLGKFKTLFVLAAMAGSFAYAEPRSCFSPDIKKRIRAKVTEASPIAGCQQSYQSAVQVCSQLVRWNAMDLGTLNHVKTVQEKRMGSCQRKVALAKQNCASDRVIISVLRAEFNDVLKCGDDSIAAINGRMMKEAQWSRRPANDAEYEPENAVTDGELNPESEPDIAGSEY